MCPKLLFQNNEQNLPPQNAIPEKLSNLDFVLKYLRGPRLETFHICTYYFHNLQSPKTDI